MLALNWLNTGSSKWTWKSSTSVEKFFIFVQRKVRNSSREKHVCRQRQKNKKIKNCYEQKNLINIFIFRTRYAKFTEIILTDWDQFRDGMNSSDGSHRTENKQQHAWDEAEEKSKSAKTNREFSQQSKMLLLNFTCVCVCMCVCVCVCKHVCVMFTSVKLHMDEAYLHRSIILCKMVN